MPFLKSIDADQAMVGAMSLNPAAGRLLVEYHTAVMRGPSPFTAGEREFIAAFVSGLNACRYCYGVHSSTAQAFGVSEALLEALVADPELAAAPDRLRPVLAYARKLTLDQSRLTQADALAVLDAGWSERALHDAICVVALFNFMNRFVHGHGLELADCILSGRGQALMRNGYGPLMAGIDKAAGDRDAT